MNLEEGSNKALALVKPCSDDFIIYPLSEENAFIQVWHRTAKRLKLRPTRMPCPDSIAERQAS